MMDYTHVILDEVHERDEDMDFLLLIVRKLLRTNSTMVKVILMSATIDVNKFSAYFSTPVENQLLPAPIIDIPKSSPYEVSIYYIDEIENLGNVSIYYLVQLKHKHFSIQERTIVLHFKNERKKNIACTELHINGIPY